MKKLAMAATCLLLLTSPVWADAYVGASVGQSDATQSGVSGDDTSWKLLGGYTFMRFAGVEASYRDLGSVDETVGATQYGLDASSMDIFGVGRLPVGEKFSVFAKAGIAFIDVDATINDPVLGNFSSSESESELAFGAGFDFAIGEKLTLRAEYETFDTEESMDMVSFGGVFRF